MNHLLERWRSRIEAVTADTSWRGLVNPSVERTEALGDAVVISTQVGRGRHYEVHVGDKLVAQRTSLAEAQAEAEKLLGTLSWRQQRIEPEDALHYYFGWTEEFTEPMTAWIGKTAALPTTRIGPLYHGTTRAAAEEILHGGFVANPERKNTVYLTRSADLAARYAEGAVKRSGGEPVVLSVAYIEGVSAHEVGYMDFNMAREAGADYSDMGSEIVVLNPWAIHGPVAYV